MVQKKTGHLFDRSRYVENELKNEKKSEFFPISNMIISRKVDNF